MWFASGIVMHFVPFPSLAEAERIAGLPIIDLPAVRHGPAEAVAVSGLKDATRVRMLQRPDGPVYLVAGAAGRTAVHASDLSDASVSSERVALAIAQDHARLRQLDRGRAAVVGLAPYDQWTVPNDFDAHRPLYRIAVNDRLGTELYVSSKTGEVVLDTTRRQRLWNYAWQHRPLDLPDSIAQPPDCVGPSGVVVLASCINQRDGRCGRWNVADQDRQSASGVPL